MPCDLGYKSFDRVVIPEPQPLTFRARAKAPEADAELMERIGQNDPAFVDWMNDLETNPLLKQALQMALAAVGKTDPVSFEIKDGQLAARATYRTGADKARVGKIAERVSRRWQVEVLAIVAQLLDFETQITVDGDVLRLEGEKHGSGSPVHEYLRITLDPASGATMMFEHFASAEERSLVRAKLLALAQKLGIRIDVTDTKESGSSIPAGAVHKHFIKHKK